jgi:hypothetical protein
MSLNMSLDGLKHAFLMNATLINVISGSQGGKYDDDDDDDDVDDDDDSLLRIQPLSPAAFIIRVMVTVAI